MPAIVKTDIRILNSDSFSNLIENVPTYAFISGQQAWSNELSPPTPLDNVTTENKVLSDVVGLKRISASNIVNVLPRTNWISGVVYDYFDNQVDMINSKNPATNDFYRFYVLTDDFNVYKCLSNNYGASSVNKPTGTSTTSFQTPDGYVWRYMYSVHPSDLLTFTTVNWMPCYTVKYNDGSPQWLSQIAAVGGSIENIVLTNTGGGYSAFQPPTVTITGDGTGATATASVNPVTGALTGINMTNVGEGYTTATVTISGIGVGATARAIISPRYGHGADPRKELGANYVMIFLELDGDESGNFATGITYRISGLISLPIGTDDGYSIKIADGKSLFYTIGDTITGTSSTSTADIVYIDYLNDLLYVDNMTGTLLQNETISSQTYNATPIVAIDEVKLPLTASEYTANSFDKQSGEILFVSYREKVSRLDQQKEDLISVISF